MNSKLWSYVCAFACVILNCDAFLIDLGINVRHLKTGFRNLVRFLKVFHPLQNWDRFTPSNFQHHVQASVLENEVKI